MPGHTYQSAVKFILSREFFGMKLGLENIRSFLDDIGSPQTKYKTIHISGTNGKGSTAAMVASILKHQGYKTGLFTSPHLVSFRERIRVNDRLISEKTITEFVDKYRKELTKRKLSFFELVAALAFYHFAKAKIDIAVIETGLGGRLDATNVLNPIVTVTTQIGKDHLEILGDTLPKIAREKAGIIKPDTPHVIGIMPPYIEKLFNRKCRKLNAPLVKLRDIDVLFKPFDLKIDYKSDKFNFKDLEPSLIGVHQLHNAALSILISETLITNGVKIKKSSITNGIENTNWKARFQIQKKRNKPLHIYDVSHNASGVESFVESFKLKFPSRKAHILTGFVKRKEHQKMFGYLSKIAEFYALVPLSTKRTTDIKELIKQIDFKAVPYRKFGKIETAYNYILKNCSKDDIVIILGSHYLVGEFFEKYKI